MNANLELMKVKSLILLFFITKSTFLLAQTKYEELKVGDKMPEYIFKNLINYPDKKANLTDFEGKLIILDFWSTNCRTCIESWPRLMSLQKKFNDKLQIILVNVNQDESMVMPVIQNQEKFHNYKMTLPSVCRDTLIKQLFPYSSVPHVVWVDKNSIVRSISFNFTVNEKNISYMLNNDSGHGNMLQKTDLKLDVDFFEPLFINGNGGNGSQLVSQSVLSKYVDGIGAMKTVYPRDDNYTRCTTIISTNSSVRDLYGFAFSNKYLAESGELIGLRNSRILLQIEDSSKYVKRDKYDEIVIDNIYSYQLTTPPTSREMLQKMMQLDLRKYFGLEARWKKLKRKCLVLSAKDTSLITYNEGSRWFTVNSTKILLNNVKVNQFIQWLEGVGNYGEVYPIIDETGLNGKIGKISIETNIGDQKSLDKALQKYGMHFSLQDREVDMLIISKPDEYQFPFDSVRPTY